VILVVITLDIPTVHSAVPWNDDFKLSSFNYTPLVLVVGIIVGIWWQVSAKHRYTGPVRTIDEQEFDQPAKPIAT
jgi:hypothetical protein